MQECKSSFGLESSSPMKPTTLFCNNSTVECQSKIQDENLDPIVSVEQESIILEIGYDSMFDGILDDYENAIFGS